MAFHTVRIIQAFLLLIFLSYNLIKNTWFFGHFLEYALLVLNDNMDEESE